MKAKSCSLISFLFSCAVRIVLCLVLISSCGCCKNPSGNDEPDTVTDFDGNEYPIVKIGDQWWMAENLKVTHYRNGDAIPNISNQTEWSNLTTGAYSVYNDDANSKDIYGCLYNGFVLDDIRDVAPEGWHVPTNEDFNQLEMYLGMTQRKADSTGWRGTDQGGKLKESGNVHWQDPNTGATNESGFSALPAGYRGVDGVCTDMGISAHLWSVTAYNFTNTWYRRLNYNVQSVNRWYGSKQNGLSLRCVKD